MRTSTTAIPEHSVNIINQKVYDTSKILDGIAYLCDNLLSESAN